MILNDVTVRAVQTGNNWKKLNDLPLFHFCTVRLVVINFMQILKQVDTYL